MYRVVHPFQGAIVICWRWPEKRWLWKPRRPYNWAEKGI